MKNLILLFILVLTKAVFAGLDCLSAHVRVFPTELPDKVDAGIVNVLRDRTRLITTFAPLPARAPDSCARALSAAGGARIGNIMDLRAGLPPRFIVGDGSITRAFVGVDARQGTRLALCVQEISQKISRNGKLRGEDLIHAVRDEMKGFLSTASVPSRLPWDLPYTEHGHNHGHLLETVKHDPIGGIPRPVGIPHGVVPLEKFLEVGESFCFERSLISALVLQHLGINVRPVMGGIETPGVGHTWLELPDGRYLDPTWNILGSVRDFYEDGWFEYGIGRAYLNQYYPFLDLTP